MRSSLSLTSTIVWFLPLAIYIKIVAAQNCYYPNGDVAEGMAACSSDGGACCPLNWYCVSNGLCYLENEDFFGRYTCTDQDWGDSCPDMCTQGGTATGNEAMLQCSDGNWCCSGNRSFDCCERRSISRFPLPEPELVEFISSVPDPSSVTDDEGSADPTSTPLTTSSRTSSSSTTERSSSTDEDEEPSITTSAFPSRSTITSSAITTDSNGTPETIIVTTNIASPTDVSSTFENDLNSNSDADDTTDPLVYGLAIGIPAAVLAAGLAFFFYRRRKRNNPSYTRPRSPPLEPNYAPFPFAPGTHAPELDSAPVAKTTEERKSELYGSEAYPSPCSPSNCGSNGMAQKSPAVSSLGGSSGGGVGNGWSPKLRGGEMGQIREDDEGNRPAELWGGYVAYRPPQGDEAGKGVSGEETGGVEAKEEEKKDDKGDGK